MKNTRYNPILIGIMILGLGFSLFLNWQRHQVEQANNTVEMAMEYESLARMARAEGLTETAVLQEFKAHGINSLVLFDTTLQKLAGKGLITVVTGPDLLHAYHTRQLHNDIWQQLADGGEIVSGAVYVTEGTSPATFQDVAADLALRFGAEKLRVVAQNPQILEVRGDPTVIDDLSAYGEQRGIMQLDLGLSSTELALAKAEGFNVIVRPVNYAHLYSAHSAPATEQIAAFFHRLDQSGARITAFIGSGKTILGYKGQMQEVADNLLQRHITLGMVENVVQLQFAPLDGLVKMAELMDYQVARTYVIDKAEQKKLKVADATRRWALTDEERNVRINYVKTFLTPQDEKTLLQTNLDYVDDITRSVEARGYQIDRAGVFAPYTPSRFCLVPVVFGALAAVLLYLTQLFTLSSKTLYSLLVVAGVFLSGLIVGTNALLARQMVALMAATILPVLSMSYILQLWEQRPQTPKSALNVAMTATWQLALAVALSLVGASYVGAILGDIRFFLEIEIYKGVKLTFILPVVLMAILYIKKYSLFEGDDDHSGIIARLQKIITKPITVQMIIGLGILGFIAWVFIGRSGHTAGVPVPALEVKLRLFLEQVMYARPREKEFLVGHPAFYLAAFAAYRNLPHLLQLALVLAATIGQGSLVQTFAHMRTPIVMSYVRALDGYLLGAILGISAVLVFALLYPAWQKWQRRYLKHE
ncbi:MAG: DUF5693 family protein [Acidaminococcaceae bacterium]